MFDFLPQVTENSIFNPFSNVILQNFLCRKRKSIQAGGYKVIISSVLIPEYFERPIIKRTLLKDFRNLASFIVFVTYDNCFLYSA